jgi:hypothetical protein
MSIPLSIWLGIVWLFDTTLATTELIKYVPTASICFLPEES